MAFPVIRRSAITELLFTVVIALASVKTVRSQDAPQSLPLSDSAIFHPSVRSDLVISGVRPHLTTYGIYSQQGAHLKAGHNECGIGAVVPWADRLWMVNYAPHQPRGSEHKLYSVDRDFKLTIYPESVGGTPAGRMIHRESKQLLIAHYLIDASGQVRVIPIEKMPIRVTAITRHLVDPANKVYYIDMEGSIWEANVHTLEVTRLFKKPVPGWHGKGAYVSQGRLVVSNNGEHAAGTYDDLLVGGHPTNDEERGVLAEFDGKDWRIIERRQYTDVTGPAGIAGGSDGDDPIWAIGWDRRSLRLKVLDGGTWSTFLLPKASFCNDARHGWYTEWPRIRHITENRLMMDMHGMFFDFPKSFGAKDSSGIRPIASHLRYVPDFCDWNGNLVLATDETSIQENPLAGQPQSNLWIGDYEDLKSWGPASAYGGPWIEDEVKANSPSDPFLVAGFDQRLIHLATGRISQAATEDAFRATGTQKITSLPAVLKSLPRVSIDRGDWQQPAAGFEFDVDVPVKVFLAVDRRGDPQLADEWKLTDLSLTWHWSGDHHDAIYVCEFPAGRIRIPGNSTEHKPGSFGMPHLAFVQSNDGRGDVPVQVKAVGKATVTMPETAPKSGVSNGPVVFTLEIDRQGDGNWTTWKQITVPAKGYISNLLPTDFDAVWLRFSTNRDCIATAYLHQTASHFADGTKSENQQLFAGLAEVGDTTALGARVYAAKRNRNLRVVTSDDRWFDFNRDFEFKADEADPKLDKLLQVEPEFTVDEASVILRHHGVNLRLPKGDAAYDRPFAAGWPRATREVESERHLANIHGTFYEVPLVTNGAPPAFNLMRPVASHRKQITDYCSWNGLLVLSGVRSDAASDGHVFADANQKTALWFGGIDDLWKLGKPIGHGGPWRNTSVKAEAPSDPYLMTGYDRKTVELSHQSAEPVSIDLQIDLNGTGLWVDYQTLDVPPGKTITHHFPTGFSASWIRAKTDRDATATVWLSYE
ncbi:MAG: hypothetical protein R3C49_19415 [Planctomycetaceae bacterium]